MLAGVLQTGGEEEEEEQPAGVMRDPAGDLPAPAC